jgi:hypothetical protein
VEDVAPWAEAAGDGTMPILIDRDHVVAERYGIVNVPTVIWIDERDRIVRPNAAEFGTDLFVEFSGKPSGPHLEALERWVVDGQAPAEDEAEVRARLALPTAEEMQARAERRLAAHLFRHGETDAAEAHFTRAGELAPLDFTIRRGSMPLRDVDPFGPAFFELYGEWEAAGRPTYESRAGSGSRDTD